jgi:hypothetical protein
MNKFDSTELSDCEIDENKEIKQDQDNIPQEIKQYFYADYVSEKFASIKQWKILKKQASKNPDKNSDIKAEIKAIDKRIINSFNTITPEKDMQIKMISHDLSKDTYVPRDSEICFFINDFRPNDNKVPADKNYLVFKFSESIKFKIHSKKHLTRSLEIFKINLTDPFNTVARFHKPCVRAYIEGDNIWMLPSQITSMMSMINIDYKYFAGSRDPILIINKYRMRGYSVILNTNEKQQMLYYNKNMPYDNGMFWVDDEKDFFGPKKLSDKIYKPKVYKDGFPQDIYNKDNNKYITTIDELKAVYKEDYGFDGSKYPIDIFKFTSISANGHVNPLQTWVSQAFYDIVNNN